VVLIQPLALGVVLGDPEDISKYCQEAVQDSAGPPELHIRRLAFKNIYQCLQLTVCIDVNCVWPLLSLYLICCIVSRFAALASEAAIGTLVRVQCPFCPSVRLSVDNERVFCKKSTDSIEMPFEVVGVIVPRNHELERVQLPPHWMGTFFFGGGNGAAQFNAV